MTVDTITAEPRTVHLHPSDNLVVAVDPLPAGAVVRGVTVRQRVARGHKLAVAPVAEGAALLKFGQVIGFASKPAPPLPPIRRRRPSADLPGRRFYAAPGSAICVLVLVCNTNPPAQGWVR